MRYFILLFVVYFGAVSAETVSEKGNKSQLEQAQKADANTKDNKKLADRSISITVSPTITTENKPADQTPHEEKSAPWEALTGISTFILAVITFGLAFFTLKLWRTTGDLVKVAEKSDKIIERAYVKISHHSHPNPALWFDHKIENQIPISLGHVALEVKNYGSTPARLTKVHIETVIASKDDTPPKIPNYRGRNVIKFGGAFLVTHDSFNQPVEFSVEQSRMEAVTSGKDLLILLGYADYIDAFGVRHRAGYARCYAPQAESQHLTNNLVFVDFDGYNYDRPREKGEGDDWDK